MKNFLSLFIALCLSSHLLFGCTCIDNTFCENIERYTDEDSDLVFMGTVIQEEMVDGLYRVVQYDVEEIYFGEIVTPDSPIYNGEEYLNTESTVWLITGGSGICMSDLSDQKVIVAVSYNQSVFGNLASFGYSPAACSRNYFEVSPTNSITGYITSYDDEQTLSLEEFEEMFDTRCGTDSPTTSTFSTPIAADFKALPQPTTGALNLIAPGNFHDWDVRIYDVDGKLIKVCSEASLDISAIDAGLYLVHFVKDNHQFIEKVTKI